MRRPLAVIGGVLVAGSVALLAVALVALRPAHLYRQRMDEGLPFFALFFLEAVAVVLALGGLPSLLVAWGESGRPAERLVRLLVAAYAALAVVTVGGTAWVASYGERCILGCPASEVER